MARSARSVSSGRKTPGSPSSRKLRGLRFRATIGIRTPPKWRERIETLGTQAVRPLYLLRRGTLLMQQINPEDFPAYEDFKRTYLVQPRQFGKNSRAAELQETLEELVRLRDIVLGDDPDRGPYGEPPDDRVRADTVYSERIAELLGEPIRRRTYRPVIFQSHGEREVARRARARRSDPQPLADPFRPRAPKE